MDVVMMLLILNLLLRHHCPLPPLRPLRHEAAETDSELRRVGEFLLGVTFSTLSALVQARGSNSGGTSAPHQLLDFSFIAIILSLAFSALHLELPRQLRLPLARLFLRLAVFFTTTAVVLLITSSISPSLRWVLFAVLFSTLFLLVCFKRFPAASLHCVAALRRCTFVVLLTGPAADDVDVQSTSNQLSPTSTDEQPVHLHGENETAALADQRDVRIQE